MVGTRFKRITFHNNHLTINHSQRTNTEFFVILTVILRNVITVYKDLKEFITILVHKFQYLFTKQHNSNQIPPTSFSVNDHLRE